jgi:membrane-bound lytic murein transglycosylase B
VSAQRGSGSRPGRPPAWCRAVTLGAAALLLVSCSAEQTPQAQEPGTARPAVASPSSPATERTAEPTRPRAPSPARARRVASRPGLPPFPAAKAGALARQLQRVVRVLRDRDAAAADARQAAQFHHLAVHAVTTRSRAYQRRVFRQLAPGVARPTRGLVRAGRLLRALTEPQPRLPKWRIVRPPPPQQLRGHYRLAQRRTGVRWYYLAAIHLVETRMGRIRGVSTAGARGPMQFLPSTWEIYGRGGDINDPRDAILAAGRLLRANGAPRNMANALYHYNPSDNYVGAVTEYARRMRRSPRSYRAFWHWRVLYRHTRGTYLLPLGFPRERPVRLPHG